MGVFPEFMKRIALLAALIVSLLGARGQDAIKPPYERRLDMPPRLQWNANYGYCGEVSFISAGLYFGQYCSQFTARALASPGVRQSQASSQLLLGVNDAKAAAAMRLATVPWKPPSRGTSKDFLIWTKTRLLAGHVPIIGVFMNEYRFYRNSNRNAGDPDYDHIVPVVGIGADAPLDKNPKAYAATDVIFFSDNGLWAPSGVPPYLFSSRFGDFQKNRRDANAPSGPLYSLRNDGRNYGIAITGVADARGDTIPVRLATSVNDERPAMKNGSNTAPAPMPLTLTVTVLIPDQGVEYNLYRYDKFENVPTSKFNAGVRKASQFWRIPRNSGPAFSLKLPIYSNQIAVFRAVRVSAP